VLLNGGGFDAPDWSVRVSFANLENHVYDDIGRAVREIAQGYRKAYEASLAAPSGRKKAGRSGAAKAASVKKSARAAKGAKAAKAKPSSGSGKR